MDIPDWRLEEAGLIHIAFVDLHDRQAEPGRFDVVAVVLADVVNKEKACGQRDIHERPDRSMPLDHRRFDDRDGLSIGCPVKALDRCGQIVGYGNGFGSCWLRLIAGKSRGFELQSQPADEDQRSKDEQDGIEDFHCFS